MLQSLAVFWGLKLYYWEIPKIRWSSEVLKPSIVEVQKGLPKLGPESTVIVLRLVLSKVLKVKYSHSNRTASSAVRGLLECCPGFLQYPDISVAGFLLLLLQIALAKLDLFSILMHFLYLCFSHFILHFPLRFSLFLLPLHFLLTPSLYLFSLSPSFSPSVSLLWDYVQLSCSE